MRKHYIFQNESMEFKQEEINALGGTLSYWDRMGKNMIVVLQNAIGSWKNCNCDFKEESIHSYDFGSLDRNDIIVADNLGLRWKANKYQLNHATAFLLKGGLDMNTQTPNPHLRYISDLVPPTLLQYDAAFEMEVQLLKTEPRRKKPATPGETSCSMRVNWAKQGFLPNNGGVDGGEEAHYSGNNHEDDVEVEGNEYKRVRLNH
jgi:hypothetical protein